MKEKEGGVRGRGVREGRIRERGKGIREGVRGSSIRESRKREKVYR